jgi:hypothetical protein
MARLRTIQIEGKRYAWREIVALYREQAKAAARPEQPLLFNDLHEDRRGPGERSASERYVSPSLFDSLKP